MKRHHLSRRMFLGGGIGVAGLISNALALSANPQGNYAEAIASSNFTVPPLINTSQVGIPGMMNMPGMDGMTNMSLNATVPNPNAVSPKPAAPAAPAPAATPTASGGASASLPFVTGDVNPAFNGFDPGKILTDFDQGTVTTDPVTGQKIREFTLISTNKMIAVAGTTSQNQAQPILFNAWTFNGRVPGPTLRCTAGEAIRVTYTNNTPLPHSIHFHGIHNADNDGATTAAVPNGGTVTYQFIAQPVGLMLYHCHVFPSLTHIGNGLYGAFIIDPPPPGRPLISPPSARPLTPGLPVKEMVMVLTGFAADPANPDKNSVYGINTVANYYAKHPIQLTKGQLARVYLLNMIFPDPPLSFHLHANMFNLYPTGTLLQPSAITDMVTLACVERCIMEFSYSTAGQYMLHSHDEPGEKGCFGLINVT